ncbi:hypothetical protein AB6A23_01950 [Paenibacillus tarimensis]
MNHRDVGFWRKYADDAVAEKEREEAETHLYTCDRCLRLYMQAVQANETIELLTDENALELTERIMADPVIRTLPPLRSGTAKRIERGRTAVHYAIAACLTLLLMSAGVFQELVAHTGEFRNDAGSLNWERDVSLTDRMMEKTSGWLDDWKEEERTNHRKDRGR